MPRPYKPRINRAEMTSDKPSRKAQAKKTVQNLLSLGYRGNPNDRSEAMYLKGVRSRGPVRMGASSNRRQKSPRYGR